MSKFTSLADRLRAGETLLSAWSSIPDPVTMEAVAATAFDTVILDMQHGGHDDGSVLRCLPAVLGAGKPAIVLIPVGRFDMASRALDFGADAVIAPMINSLDDARRFAAAMKYPPVGGRSWGPTIGVARRGAAGGQAYLECANAQTLAFAMIETREAFEIADAILDVDGIDGVFVGPSDFSIAWSGGHRIDPLMDDMMEAIGAIAAKATARGKLSAIYAINPAICAAYAAMGYRLMAVATEGLYMAAGAAAMVADARAAMDKA